MWTGYFILYGNFHQVDADVFRSAQLFKHNLPYYIEKYGIKSIVNLRGQKQDKWWYQDEIEISREYNLSHYDFRIGSRSKISQKEMDHIVEIISQAPKPVLIHCKAGADRTSLAVALYLYAVKHDTNSDRALSILYGHFPWFGSKTIEMDRSFEAYQREKRL